MKAVLDWAPAKQTALANRDCALFTAMFAIVATVIIAPLAVIDLPLLADYPNHVARMHVIGNVDDDVFLDERYVVRFDLIPNIAMDLVVPWLANWMPLDIAGRLFLAVGLISTLAGVAFLHRTIFNHWSPYPLLAALFVHHGSLIAGMANFSLGIGLVPAALAVWIRLTNARPVLRLLIGSAMALALFFCHLVAFGAFGLLLVGRALARAGDSRWRRERLRLAGADLALAGAVNLLPLLLFARLVLSGDDGSGEPALVFGNLAWKLKALLAPLAQYNLPLDIASFGLIAGLGLIGWRTGRLVVDRRMVPGLVLLAAAFILAPKALWTGGVFDQRLAVLLALMMIACTRSDGEKGGDIRALSALLAVLLALRVGVLTSVWLDHRQDLVEMRRAIDMVPRGARILVVQPDDDAGQRLAPPRHRVFHHAVQLPSLPTLAVVEKSAFVSTLYALDGQQPLSLKPPFDRLGGRGSVDLPTLDDLAEADEAARDHPSTLSQIRNWTTDFDHVVLIYAYGPSTAALAGNLPLEPLLDGEILDLFRITGG